MREVTPTIVEWDFQTSEPGVRVRQQKGESMWLYRSSPTSADLERLIRRARTGEITSCSGMPAEVEDLLRDIAVAAPGARPDLERAARAAFAQPSPAKPLP